MATTLAASIAGPLRTNTTSDVIIIGVGLTTVYLLGKVASTSVFLASEGDSYSTSQAIHPSGGETFEHTSAISRKRTKDYLV
ncbi:hypothetical protein [Hymenobacter bucti]|uniref:hypothetical protein n=1 Tax=Hymenobacter bucti TaxID=1844114 RepID=UPI0036D2259F